MYSNIPAYGMRAYALFFSKFGAGKPFRQSELDFLVSSPMKKKIFALLLKTGWIRKKNRVEYLCEKPGEIFSHFLDFRVPEIMKEAEREYCFSGASAIEVWSDYSYMQRGRGRSPYFIRVLEKDLGYWKGFFSRNLVPSYVKEGTSIGEFIILVPARKIMCAEKDGLRVEPLEEAAKHAKENEMFSYAYGYMRRKYGKACG